MSPDRVKRVEPMTAAELETERLFMRQWRGSDLEPFSRMNSDPEVMRYFVTSLSRSESDAFAEQIVSDLDSLGYGLWALEVKETGAFVGFTGLVWQTYQAHFTPAVEIGWRLARSSWGLGYASEAARMALAFGFDTAGLDEIVSTTAAQNTRSQRVMERIGMSHDRADDFLHPNVPEGHVLRSHVLYRIRRPNMRKGERTATVPLPAFR